MAIFVRSEFTGAGSEVGTWSHGITVKFYHGLTPPPTGGRCLGVHVRFLRSRPPPPPAAQPDGNPWERGRPARILSLPTRPPPPVPGRPHPAPLNGVLGRGAPDCPEMPLVAKLAIDAAGSQQRLPLEKHNVPYLQWCRSRLIEVGEIGEAVPGLVRAGRPRSQEVVIPWHHFSPSRGE